MKSKIFCLIGCSGVGKSMIAEALEKYADIPMIRSYTDRPPRTTDENSHTFLSKEEFDLLDKNDMIAFTQWSEYRYACLHKDVSPVCTYVLDPSGLIYLQENFLDRYDVYSILIKRPQEIRIKCVGRDRVERDEGKFFLPDEHYDKVIYNATDRKLDVITDVWQFVRTRLDFQQYLSEKEYNFLLGIENELSE